MKHKTGVLLVLLLAPWFAGAQQDAVPSAAGVPSINAQGDQVFEETEPPRWMNEQYPAQSKPAVDENDPLLRKIRDVGAEMDKTSAVTSQVAPVEEPPQAEPERSPVRTYLQGFAALIVVVALIFLLTYFLKRFGRRAALFPSPELVQVLGRVYLTSRISLHFVRTGGKVLVLAVAQNQASLLTEFDAAVFEAAQEQAAAPKAAAQTGTAQEDFFLQFRSDLQKMAGAHPPETPVDEEIAALRKDIERLQTYLQEDARGEKG